MATPRNPLEAFIWGSGGRAMTPEQVAREREIAAALTDQGADFSPVGHWLQGAARLGHSAAGAFRKWRADEAEAAGRGALSDRWSSVFGGGASPVAEALSGGVASPALDAANGLAATGDMQAYRDAIASIESAGSGDYAAVGPKHPKLGRALGRYQIMEANIGPWSREALGQEITPEQFMANPKLQDAIFDHRFGQYVKQFGPEGAAQAWFAGPGGVGKMDRRDSFGTTVSAYTDKFSNALGGAQAGMAGATGSQGWTPYRGGAQASQAGVTPSIAELLALSGDPNFGYASPAQQQIVQALMGQQLQQQDPAYQQGLALGDVNLRRGEFELEQLMNPPAPFQPIPLSAEERAAFGIPKGSGSWVWGEDGMPTQLYDSPEDPTSVREYEYYLQQADALGLQPVPYVEWDNARKAAGATNISNVVGGETGPKLGSLSSDYGYVLDPETGQPVIDPETGLPTAAPVPGSPAAREIEAAQAQAESREAQTATQAGTVTQDAGIALQAIGELSGLSADNGPAGANWRAAQAAIRGTPEYRIQRFVNSALANVGFDQLNQMRQNSPTGGALGNVTELQLRQLESVLGQYDIGLPIEDQQFILQRISNIYSDIIFGSRAERNQAVREGKMTQEQADRYDQYYYPETRDAMGRPLEQSPAPSQSQPSGDIDDILRGYGL